jgi:hypothetical protein
MTTEIEAPSHYGHLSEVQSAEGDTKKTERTQTRLKAIERAERAIALDPFLKPYFAPLYERFQGISELSDPCNLFI